MQQGAQRQDAAAAAHWRSSRPRADEGSTPEVAEGGRRRGLIGTIVVLVLVAALAVGLFLVIRSGQLSAWLHLNEF
jgi:hypothetical protein